MADLTPGNYWPLGSTVQDANFPADTSYPSYRHFGFISVNPVNGHTVILYRRGTTHAADAGSLCIRHSNSGGVNWDNEVVLFSESGVDLRNLGGGYDSTGKLFLFYARYNYISQVWLSMNYRYSDNDGSTWSNQQTYQLCHKIGLVRMVI